MQWVGVGAWVGRREGLMREDYTQPCRVGAGEERPWSGRGLRP